MINILKGLLIAAVFVLIAVFSVNPAEAARKQKAAKPASAAPARYAEPAYAAPADPVPPPVPKQEEPEIAREPSGAELLRLQSDFDRLGFKSESAKIKAALAEIDRPLVEKYLAAKKERDTATAGIVIPKKDEYETQAEYNTKRSALLKKKGVAVTAFGKVSDNLVSERNSKRSELAARLEKRLHGLLYAARKPVTPLTITIGTYSPETEKFPVTISTQELRSNNPEPAITWSGDISIPRTEAKQFKEQSAKLTLKGELITRRNGSRELVNIVITSQITNQTYAFATEDAVALEPETAVASALAGRSLTSVMRDNSGGTAFMDPTTAMEFVPVPGGCFQMGDTFGDGDNNEKPVHEVCVSSFSIGKYEVTQKQWQKIMGNNPSSFKQCGDNCPVENVSWDDVQQFLEKLNSENGTRYRLPTEAEWEYAARSGGRQEKYSGSNNVDAVAWYYGNSGETTHRVGSKQPNGLGIYDMSGNVLEWCSDWYDKNYYRSSPRNNPPGASSGQYRVLRGGSWNYDVGYTRAARRNRDKPVSRFNSYGLRLASPAKD